MTTRLTLYANGASVAALPPPVSTLASSASQLSASTVSAPTVSFDTTATVLRTAALSIVDATGTLVPGDGSTLLQPIGNEILIESTDNAGLWVAKGLLGIVTAEVDDSVDSSGDSSVTGEIGPVVTLDLQDRAFAFGQSTPTATVQYPDGIPLEVATYLLLSSACPWVPDWCYQLESTGLTLPAPVVDIGANPWSTCATWWRALGARLFADETGNIVGTTEPIAPVPYTTFQPGDGHLTGLSAIFDGIQAYNGVTVTASNPATSPVQATAWDTDPTSPTYYLGTFGQRAAPAISSDVATTEAQCYLAAVGYLPLYLGLARTVDSTIVPDPYLTPWTCAQIVSPKDKVSGLWYAQSGIDTLDNSASQSVVWVPAGRPLNWGQSGQ